MCVGKIKSELYQTAGDEMHEYELPVCERVLAFMPVCAKRTLTRTSFLA